jgi:hypothetical protein
MSVRRCTEPSFVVFVELGSTVLYEKYVLTPVFVNEAKTHMREFEEASFPGCVGSSDATHITTDRCEYNKKSNHLGPKSTNEDLSISEGN